MSESITIGNKSFTGEQLKELCQNENQRVLIFLMFVQHMTPNEIVQQHSRLFPDEQEVQRVFADVMGKLAL